MMQWHPFANTQMRRPSGTRTARARAAAIWVLLLALVFAQGFGALHRAAHGFAAAQVPGQGHAHAPSHSHSHSHGDAHAHDWADSCDHELLDAVLGHAAGSELCQQLDGLHNDLAVIATSNAVVNWEPARAVHLAGTAPPGKYSCLTPPVRGPPLTV